jgi:hypothetical protein
MKTRRELIAGRYHAIHIHDCPRELLRRACEAATGLVVVENLCPNRTTEWAEFAVQLWPPEPASVHKIRSYSMDVQLKPHEFLRYMDLWDSNGVYAVFVSRAISFRASDLKNIERYRALDNFEWSLELAIPSPSGPDWGTITSPHESLIDGLAS